MDEPPLTTHETALAIGVTRMTISRWVKAGKLKPFRQLHGPTGAFLFRREDVERIASTRKETTTA